MAWKCGEGRIRNNLPGWRGRVRKELFKDLQVGQPVLASENWKNFERLEQQVKSQKEGQWPGATGLARYLRLWNVPHSRKGASLSVACKQEGAVIQFLFSGHGSVPHLLWHSLWKWRRNRLHAFCHHTPSHVNPEATELTSTCAPLNHVFLGGSR